MENFLKKIDYNNIPNHVAVIMDGNGRWAEKRGKLRTYGYEYAITSVKETLIASQILKIPYITLYVFSSENWKRPKKELDYLINLFTFKLESYLEEINKKNIKTIVIGNIKKFPTILQKVLLSLIETTKNNTSGTLVLALSYSSKDEILRATKNIAKKIYNKQFNIEDINYSFFQKHLYTKNLPDVDLIIRTSGEKRISNFLLWQSAYAELYFTNIFWPDFRRKDFFEAIISFQKRKRRFGKIK